MSSNENENVKENENENENDNNIIKELNDGLDEIIDKSKYLKSKQNRYEKQKVQMSIISTIMLIKS